VAQLRPRVGEIEEAGAGIVAIGNGSVAHLGAFIDAEAPGFPAYTDPSLQVYELAQLSRGIGATLAPAAGVRALAAMARGHRQGAGIKGDALQQGGVLLVLPGGKVAWRHASRHSGDHPDAGTVVTAVREALGARKAAPSRRKRGSRRTAKRRA
jgi:hypothetical protein